jgi:hypothetical protein
MNGAALHRPETKAERAAYSFRRGKENENRDEHALVNGLCICRTLKVNAVESSCDEVRKLRPDCLFIRFVMLCCSYNYSF